MGLKLVAAENEDFTVNIFSIIVGAFIVLEILIVCRLDNIISPEVSNRIKIH